MKLLFLTDNLDYINNSIVKDVFRELLLSVTPAYRKPRKFINLRSKFRDHRLAFDSGGFDFLMGKLRNPDPLKTVKTYRLLGYRRDDLLIQLDLPPSFSLPKKDRIKLIKKSAEFYHIMRTRIHNIVPILHGWDKEELELSLNLINDADILGVSTFVSQRRVFDYIGKKVIGTGTYQVSSVIKNVPRKLIYERLGLALKLLLQENDNIFVLGASGPTTLHISFLLGARYADGSVWRITAVFKGIILPDGSRRSIPPFKRPVYPKLKGRDIEAIKNIWGHHLNPLDTSVGHFLETASRNDKYGFIARALWNAFMLKYIELTASEFEDPLKYYKFLSKIWPKYKLRYAKIAMDAAGQEKTMQPKLDAFLR
jgi:hypothetical protein